MSIIAFPRVLSSRRWRSISLLGATIVLGWLAVPVRHTQSQATVPDYKNAHLPVEQRVSDLLSRMTLEEKAGSEYEKHRRTRLVRHHGGDQFS